MCGIFGGVSLDFSGFDLSTLSSMAASLQHRGPDSSGIWQNSFAALGNTRLSIIDPTDLSNQPQFNDDKSVVVVQNGEIYNYKELRSELLKDGFSFKTNGDTEVLLNAFLNWGPDFVKKLNGMFAICIFDSRGPTPVVWLYRDRLGVKPLFFYKSSLSRYIWFASEIKTLIFAGAERKVNLSAISQFFALNYIPHPQTAFQNIEHVPPGHLVKITPSSFHIEEYWSLKGISQDFTLSRADVHAKLLSLLDDSVRIRMRSDVPFGAFLSGGLDSSSVVGIMSQYQTSPIQTYSIGFEDARYDESQYAQMASQRFGTLHRKYISPSESTSLWSTFLWFADQPHGDISFIPTYQVAALASEDVKMVLTGDGGDELFAGYEKYAKFFSKIENFNVDNWELLYAKQSGLVQGDESEKLLINDLRQDFIETNPYASLTDKMNEVQDFDPINRVLYADISVLLPGNNLVKPDRMSMANSLEVRSPFLDFRLAEFAMSVPGSMKLTNGETKSVYKEAVQPLLGDKLTYRKKQMFTVPVGEWFKNSLNQFCLDTLFDGRLESRGTINTSYAKLMFDRHVSGKFNYTRQLRALISLEIWYRIYIDSSLTQLSAPDFNFL